MKKHFTTGLITALAISAPLKTNANEIINPTGLDQIHHIINTDAKLNKKATDQDLLTAHQSISTMNSLLKKAIISNGLANDGFISIADTREINRYLIENYADEWYQYRGENLGDNSTGFYTVNRKHRRSETTVQGTNAVSLWGKIYNLGFTDFNQKNKSLTDYTGRKSASFSSVGYALGEIIHNDVSNGSLTNVDFQEVSGTTETSLDSIVQAILTDEGLIRKIATGDIRQGALAADAMNHLIIEAIKAEGLGNDGKLSTADIRLINQYLVDNAKGIWPELHGDDENDEETSFHLVQNDGARARMFADNVVNSVADGIYHLGFETNFKNNLANEDGDKNKRFEKVAWWLDTILKNDLKAGKLNNPDYQEVIATTGTAFDFIIDTIFNDEGLLLKVSMADIREGARSANGMNELLVEGIRATHIADDHFISTDEVRTLNQYLVANHAQLWAELHGDDEDTKKTGYHLVQNDGARGVSYGKNIINQWADSVYHLGFYTSSDKRLVNEDGDKNASFKKLSYWLNMLLQEDYEKGIF